MRSAITNKIATFCADLRMINATTATYFAFYNLFFASYVLATGNANYAENKKVSEGIDYAAYVFSTIAVLSTIASIITKYKTSSSQTALAVTLTASEGSEEVITQPQPSLPLYKNILCELANVGTVVAPFNLERLCNAHFDADISSPFPLYSYFSATILMSGITVLVKPLKSFYRWDSPLVTVFTESCVKSGSLIGAIFAGLLLQIECLGLDSIHPKQGDALSEIVSGLFIADICLLYAALRRCDGNLEEAQKWIRTKLLNDLSTSDKIRWHLHLVMDTLRELFGVMGTFLGIANILYTSAQFREATQGAVRESIFVGLGGAALFAGVSNARKMIVERSKVVQDAVVEQVRVP